MDLSKIKKFDDNSLFRLLSKSYSKNYSKDDYQSLTRTQNLSEHHHLTRYEDKLRSQSTSLCNNFSKSVSITQNHSLPRPGFLKYRNFSTNESAPLNLTIETPKNLLHKLSISLKTMDDKNFSSFKKTVSEFQTNKSTTQQFGLRNLVKRVKNEFRLSGDQLGKTQSNKQFPEYELLCDKSKKMFMGHKSYNLNSFVITDNAKGLSKRGNNVIKTSIMKRKLKKGLDKDVNMTLG